MKIKYFKIVSQTNYYRIIYLINWIATLFTNLGHFLCSNVIIIIKIINKQKIKNTDTFINRCINKILILEWVAGL